MKPIYKIVFALIWIVLVLTWIAVRQPERARIVKAIESKEPSRAAQVQTFHAPQVDYSISCEKRTEGVKVCDVYGEMKGAKNLPAGPFLRWHCALSDKQTRCDPVMSIYAELGGAR